MTVDESTRPGGLAPSTAHPLADRDVAWLGAGFATWLVVYAAYLLTHPYPAYAGGLFLAMADAIAADGYALPTTITHHTETGVPFAYPPLLFYVVALGHDLTGASLLAFARYLPGAFVLAYLVPYYGIARELLGTPRRAGLATVLFAATPTVLRWHLSAGGLVRAPAMFLALTGVYVGLRLFRDRDRRWVAPAVVLFGLQVLTHPTYTTFFGLSYLLLYAFFDRTRAGLLAGAVVAAGGLLVASPWLLTVVDRHGVDVFLTASGTHSGLAGGLRRLAVNLTYALNDWDVESVFYYAAYAGGAYALLRGRYFLPAWLVASSYLVGKNRFLFVAGSMLSAVFVVDVVRPRLREWASVPARRRALTTGAVLAVVVGAAAVGGLYAASALPLAHEESPSQPPYMDAEDRAAMEWAEGATEPTDEFVVFGDPAEWLPLYADRTTLLGPWGWEWKETSGYYRELARYDDVATCPSATCVTAAIEGGGWDPEYVYLTKGEYTVRGKRYERPPEAIRSMRASDRYTLAFENEGVAIFAVEEEADSAGRAGPGSDRGSRLRLHGTSPSRTSPDGRFHRSVSDRHRGVGGVRR